MVSAEKDRTFTEDDGTFSFDAYAETGKMQLDYRKYTSLFFYYTSVL